MTTNHDHVLRDVPCLILCSQRKRIKKMTKDNEMPELLPCPFCGGEARVNKYKSARKNVAYTIGCLSCFVSPRTKQYATKIKALREWNTRADHVVQALRDRIAVLEGALNKAEIYLITVAHGLEPQVAYSDSTLHNWVCEALGFIKQALKGNYQNGGEA